MEPIKIPKDSSVSRQQWQQAWNPVEVLLRYFVASFVLAGVALIPLAWAFGPYALVGVVSLPVLGIVLGIAVWRRSCTAVNSTYQEILDDIIDRSTGSDDGSQVWTSGLVSSGEQYYIKPAQEYTLTYVEATAEYTLIEEITVDLAELEMSMKSERIPSHKISSQSFESGTLRLHSPKGIWNLNGLEEIPRNETNE